MKKNHQPFNVIVQDINARNSSRDSFPPYDIMPYFMNAWEHAKSHKYLREKMPKDLQGLKEWLIGESRYMFWGRCEWEVIVCGWPNEETQHKLDVHEQIMMNIDLIVKIFADNIKFDKYLENIKAKQSK